MLRVHHAYPETVILIISLFFRTHNLVKHFCEFGLRG